MELEQQVCSLEIAKRLKELGVKQENLYYWLEASDGARLMKNPILDTYKYFKRYSAFTVAELGEMLPRGTKSYLHKCVDGCDSRYFDKEISYECQLHDKSKTTTAETEANARARMLIYLLENNLIKK